jgi:hypothetical protein
MTPSRRPVATEERRGWRARVALAALAFVAGSCHGALNEAAAGGACLSTSGCASDQYCAFPTGLCRRGGICRARPRLRQTPRAPVCGCDGNVYESEENAHALGVDLAGIGGCGVALAGWAPCGARFCDARTSYCEIDRSDPEVRPTYSCRPLPAACRAKGEDAASCECFPARTPCRDLCVPLFTGARPGFQLVCPAVREPRVARERRARGEP